MYRGRSLTSVFKAVFAAAFAFAAPVFAQDGDAEEFSAPLRPAQMTAEGGDADFGAALEAAAAAEGRSAGSAEGKEFVPKNEITVTKKPVKADNSAKKKEKKPKAESSGETLGNTMGARLGVGYDIDLSLGFGIGMSDVNRLGVGLNMGWGSFHQYNFATYEGYGYFDWNFNISDDGALRWFVGPGITFGVYGAESDTKPTITQGKDTTWTSGNSVGVRTDTLKYERDPNMKYAFSVGLGGRTGLEVDLSFIDPDHALSMLRSSSVSLDVRFVLYLFTGDEQKNYPSVVPTLGITYNYVFGGGKSKEKKP
jgi:hypothetical protein